MSLVLGYADEEKAIIISDGRAKSNVVLSESYDKTRKINENIILGFVGGKEPAEYFLDCVYQSFCGNVEGRFIEEFLEVVEYGVKRALKNENFDATFLIMGRKENGKIATAIAGKGVKGGFMSHEVMEPRMQHIGGSIPRETIGRIYSENLGNAGVPILECMKKTIKDVSMLDSSINSTMFIRTI